MSELITVAKEPVSTGHFSSLFCNGGILPIVISPPPPNPVRPLITSSCRMVWDTEHPMQPTMKAMVETKKHILLPNMSESRPYSGWKAVLVTK